jgi:hypothetical protein
VAGEGVFEHDAARADVQRLNDLLGGDGGGEQQILTVGVPFMMARMASRPGRRGICTSSSRMSGSLFEGLGDGLVAVGGFADHFKAVLFGEHVAHADADYRMVVRQYNSNWSFHLMVRTVAITSRLMGSSSMSRMMGRSRWSPKSSMDIVCHCGAGSGGESVGVIRAVSGFVSG